MSEKRKATRRANHEGSIYKRADGRWYSQVLTGYHPETGQPVRKTFYGYTQKEVLEKKEAALAELQKTGPLRKTPALTVRQFMTNWLFQHKRVSITSRTFEWYNNLMETHIFPALGSVTLSGLTSSQVQSMLTDCAETRSHRTVKAIRDTLNQALNHAVEQRLVAENPVHFTYIPRYDRRVQEQKGTFTESQIASLLEASAKDHIMKPIIRVLLYTGLRSGELLGLIWGNVNLEKQELTIDRALTQETSYDADGKRTERKTVVAVPKTQAGKRKIPFSRQVGEALEEWKRILENRDPALTASDKPVFCNMDGVRRTYGGFRTVYRNFLRRHGLDDEGLNLHRFRHTYASMLAQNGVNPSVAQQMLGHRDIKTTLGTYTHVNMAMLRQAADNLEFQSKKTSPELQEGESQDETE